MIKLLLFYLLLPNLIFSSQKTEEYYVQFDAQSVTDFEIVDLDEFGVNDAQNFNDESHVMYAQANNNQPRKTASEVRIENDYYRLYDFKILLLCCASRPLPTHIEGRKITGRGSIDEEFHYYNTNTGNDLGVIDTCCVCCITPKLPLHIELRTLSKDIHMDEAELVQYYYELIRKLQQV